MPQRMFRAFEVAPEGRPHVVTPADVEAVGPIANGNWRWLDCVGPTEAELALLQERFGFHPVTIADCAKYDHRPKLEFYDDYLFIVIHLARPSAADSVELDAIEIHAFLSSSYLVTVHDSPTQCIDSTWHRLAQEPAQLKRGPAYAYYLLADAALSQVFPWVEDLIERIENVEDVLAETPSSAALADAYRARKVLASIRRLLSPQREVFSSLIRLDSPILGKKMVPFFRAVHDDVLRLTELVETAREHVANLREAYASALSQRTNVVVQRLTVLSAIFLPLTFLTGFFGQNFEALPFTSRWLFWAVVTTTVLLPVGMLSWFKGREWW
jgi:magnesium transporter